MGTQYRRWGSRDRRRASGTATIIGLCILLAAGSTSTAQTAAPQRAFADRVLHDFTFTEPENFDPVPMYWVPFQTLPAFAIGRFDPHVGHESPPSFYLGLNGRDVAYRYLAPPSITPVRPDSDYEIVGWIKPDRLHSARAWLTAFYVDREGNPIPGTQVFSPLVGGGPQDAWRQVTVHLPAGPREAQCIGLTVRVVQERTWRTASLPHRYIEPTDVHGGAWFDDVAVYRLPRARITVAAAGRVFVAPDRPIIDILVTDSDPRGLTASLNITDAAGQLVDTHDVPIGSGENTEATQFRFANLDPGLYQATLRVQVGDETLVSRRRAFAFVAESRRGAGAVSRPFGVVLDGPGQTDHQLALLLALRAGTVKLPLWSGSTAHPGFAEAPDALKQLLHDLVKARVATIGVFAGPPHELVRSAEDVPRPLLDILNDDPTGWRDQLAKVVAPHASIFQSWQVGPDDDPATVDPAQQIGALEAVRREMEALITSPTLTAPVNAHDAPAQGPLPAENVCLTIDADIQPAWIADHLKGCLEAEYHRVGAYIQPSRTTHDRLAALSDLAKRVIHARHAGADRVLVSQLWRTRSTVDGPIVEPTEEFIIFRTIADLLADAQPGYTLDLADGVNCLSFTSGDQATMALWDEGAPPEGRDHVLQLGAATHQIDLWGRTTPLVRTADGRHVLHLSPLPVFVDHVEQWLVAFRVQLKLDPSDVPFRIGSHTHTLTIAASGHEPVSGTMFLHTPETWEVRPRSFLFAIPPRGVVKKEIQIRYANNEPAGQREVLAEIDFDSGGHYHMEVHLRFNLGLPGIEVWAYAVMQDDRLIVRHGLHNRSNETISFRGFAAAPGRTRQYRVYTSIAPGQNVVKEYHFDNAANLSGRTLRVGLREVGGPRGHNLEVKVP